MDKIFTSVTLHGFPVRIELDWPFHRSEGGSDYYVVHGKLQLDDGSGLHADVALNLAQTVREALASIDSDLAFSVAVNSARKALDDRRARIAGEVRQAPAGSGVEPLLQHSSQTLHLCPRLTGASARVRRAKGRLGEGAKSESLSRSPIPAMRSISTLPIPTWSTS